MSVAAELARWRTWGVSPRCGRPPRAPRRTPRADGPPSGAAARRPRPGATTRPTASRQPSACSFRAWSTRSAHCPAVAPPRDRPVSILRCTRAVRPVARAAAAISSSAQDAPALRSMSALIAAAKSSPGTCSHDSRRPVSPAWRRARPSASWATPEPRRAAGARGPGARHQTVAVGVGLHHGHHLGRSGVLAQGGDVRPHGPRSTTASAGSTGPVWSLMPSSVSAARQVTHGSGKLVEQPDGVQRAPVARQRTRSAVHRGGHGPGERRFQPGREQRAGEARQHVARARRWPARPARRPGRARSCGARCVRGVVRGARGRRASPRP